MTEKRLDAYTRFGTGELRREHENEINRPSISFDPKVRGLDHIFERVHREEMTATGCWKVVP